MKKVFLGVAVLSTAILGLALPAAKATTTSQSAVNQNQVSAVPSSSSDTGWKTAASYGLTVYQPPKGFDPFTASQSQLQQYGFPRRPTNPGGLKSWEQAMKSIKTFIVPEFKSMAAKACSFTQSNSPNWSGYISNTSNATETQGTFTVPNLLNASTSQPDGAEVAVWNGIGGDNNSHLIQAGADAKFHNLTNGVYQTQYLWWEALPDYASMQQISMSTYAGDTIYVSCTYNPSTGFTSFYVEDESTGQVASFSKDTAADYYGGTAEWVTERPDYNTYYAYLADYPSENFTGSTVVEDGTDYAIGNTNNIGPVLMYDTTCTTLANASSLTSPSSFVDYWHAYGNQAK